MASGVARWADGAVEAVSRERAEPVRRFAAAEELVFRYVLLVLSRCDLSKLRLLDLLKGDQGCRSVEL